MWIKISYPSLSLLIITILFLPSVLSSSSFCGKLTKIPKPSHKLSSRSLQLLYTRETTWSPIRIQVDFVNYDISSNIHKYLKQIVDYSIQWYNNVLKVKRLTSNLFIDDSFQTIEELDLIIPDKYYNEGVEADYLIFIIILTDPDSSTAGGATYLQRDAITNQPVVGILYINYVEKRNYSFDDFFFVATHEIAHALAFSDELYEYFIDSSGEPYQNIIKADTNRGATVYKITTPNVVKYARETFDCADLDGVELEITGGEGSVLSHWEKRIMNGDFMVANLGEEFLMTDITLGLFEDSGWYKPNYEYTQNLVWGRGLGCEFLETKCFVDQKPSFDVFCVDDGKKHCDYLRLNKGTCKTKDYKGEIPDEYAYFGNNDIGGDSFLDYCPVIYPESGGNCRGLDLIETETNPLYGEQVCENCRCVEGTYSKFMEAHHHVGCHWIECESDYTIVHIGNEALKCDSEGGEVEVPNYNGVLYCPKWDEVCNPVPCMNACSGIGICNRGVCECPDGNKGGDCTGLMKDFSYRDESANYRSLGMILGLLIVF